MLVTAWLLILLHVLFLVYMSIVSILKNCVNDNRITRHRTWLRWFDRVTNWLVTETSHCKPASRHHSVSKDQRHLFMSTANYDSVAARDHTYIVLRATSSPHHSVYSFTSPPLNNSLIILQLTPYMLFVPVINGTLNIGKVTVQVWQTDRQTVVSRHTHVHSMLHWSIIMYRPFRRWFQLVWVYLSLFQLLCEVRQYLSEFWWPVTVVQGRQHHHSVRRGQLDVMYLRVTFDAEYLENH